MSTQHTLDSFQPSQRSRNVMLLSCVTGAVIAVAGILVAPSRMFPNILLAGYYLVGVGVSATLFLAFTSVTNAGWTAVIRRVPEALSNNVYAGALLMVVLLAGVHSVYEWSHIDVVAADALLQAKSPWLNTQDFIIRTFVYLLLWGGGTSLVLRSIRRETVLSPSAYASGVRRVSGLFIVIVAVTFWLASMDWIMSIEPHWYSTIFGLYNFSGSFLAGLALITVVVILLRRQGAFGAFLRDDHLHDLGKLLFAFSTFWMYIWFSQYILIWYANIPEETVYYIRRETAGWGTLTLVNIGFNWLAPFILLLPARAKRHEGLLLRVCFIILLGHWVDLFVMIFPQSMPETPTVHVWELGAVALALGLSFFACLRGIRSLPLVPRNDPYLLESLTYHA